MELTTSEVETLRQLRHVQLVQLRKAGKVGMYHKLPVYRARIDALDKVIDTARVEAADELLDEVERVTQRLQEGRY